MSTATCHTRTEGQSQVGTGGWLRVNKRRPCPICEHTNWCLISTDGSAVICPRTPSDKRAGEAGYLHKLRDDETPRRTRRRQVRIAKPQGPRHDLSKLAEQYRAALNVAHLRFFAGGLGLSCDSLMRLEKVGETFRPVSYQVFGPKALAAIANLPESLASRCIRVCMFRAAPDSPKPRRRLDAEPGRWQEIRDDLHVTALEHGRTWLELADRPDVVPAELAGRDFELWQPLLALASWLQNSGADGLLKIVPDHALQACDLAGDLAVQELDELLLKLLVERVVANDYHLLKAGDLLKSARELEPKLFERWSPRGVGSALRRYGLVTQKGHGSTGRTYRLVTLEALQLIERTYGFELGLPPAHVPHVPHVPQGAPTDN